MKVKEMTMIKCRKYVTNLPIYKRIKHSNQHLFATKDKLKEVVNYIQNENRCFLCVDPRHIGLKI